MNPRDRMLSIAIVIGGAGLALLLYIYLPAKISEPAVHTSKPAAVAAQPAPPATDLWSWAKSEILPHGSTVPGSTAAGKTNPAAEPVAEESAASTDADDIYASCDPLEGEEAAACIERVDQRVEVLQDACDKYEDDADRWQDCMEAANQSKEY